MNDLTNTYVYRELSHEDIDILRKSTDDINDKIQDLLHLLKLNKLPIIDKLLKLVHSGEIRLVYDERLLHATVKWVYDKGIVLVNVTPSAKRKKGLEEAYNIPSNELYSYIIGAAVFYYSNQLCKDRSYVRDCLNIYMDIIGRVFTKNSGGHFSGPEQTSRFHYILGKYLLLHNKTAISNINAFVALQSGISNKAINILEAKYKDKDYENFETLIENVIKQEFPFMDKVVPMSLIHTLSTMIGASNSYMLENIDTIGAIMVDHVMGNRATLFSRYPAFKGMFKSTMYNNVVDVLKNV